jgi:S-DNA-T family DNA segregation ATPase FtsK/SpoIIIE
MAKTIKKEPLDKKTILKLARSRVVLTKQHKIVLVYLIFCCFTGCFISFFLHGQEDQSAVSELIAQKPSKIGW